MRFLIDTNVLVDVFRENAAAIEYVDTLGADWAVSQVTAMELIVGTRDKRELVALDRSIAMYRVLSLSDSIGATAYQLLTFYAKSHGLDVFDSLIAATAMGNQLTLVTRNRKHFQMIGGLTLEVPAYSFRLN